MYPDEIPDTLVLHQNYPNPFNPVTVIEYELKQNTPVTLRVFDVAGWCVHWLINIGPVGNTPFGSTQMVFRAEHISASYVRGIRSSHEEWFYCGKRYARQ